MLKKIFNPFGNNNPNGQPYIPENYDYKRLETELNESKRLISELTKRIARLENYLGIRTDQKYYY